jgi:tRNA-specific 2-thiouridylase
MDSAVAALLLKQRGCDVMGIHARLWDADEEDHVAQVCHTLDIPCSFVDLHQEFIHYVVDYFSAEYLQGRTPNPCARCNRDIKFGLLLDAALSQGADYFTTGHYARVEHAAGSYHLLRAVDTAGDQSYFLYGLEQEKLSHIIFPLGTCDRTEVRDIAAFSGLPKAQPSQDLCFVSRKNYRAFLDEKLSSAPGDIVDGGGNIVGHHQGIANYTVGQRRGIGLAEGHPLYVIRIEPELNRIVVGGAGDLYRKRAVVKELNWISGEAPACLVKVAARIRYRAQPVEASVSPPCGPAGAVTSDVCFSQPQRAIVPGQAIVFYQGDNVLGGGIITGVQPGHNGGSRKNVAATRSL